MTWTIDYSREARDQIAALDKETARRIRDKMNDVERAPSPRALGKALTGPLAGLWRYRVGKYRVICDIKDDVLVVLALAVGLRDKVYRAPRRP